MPNRKEILAEGEYYHVLNKSIAGFKIFNDEFEFTRIISVIRYYQKAKPCCKFSKFIKLIDEKENQGENIQLFDKKERLVEIIAYCIMPTHFHLILKQLNKNGISTFMRRILDSYTRYFNTKHERKGPLWEGRFKHILVKNDEQLLHLTRYIHLNPVTAYLVEGPEIWKYSSYKEYLLELDNNYKICKFDSILSFKSEKYKKFVEDRIAYQRELAEIKALLLE